MSGSPQDRAALAFARRLDLQKRLLDESRWRINRVRKTVGYDRLPEDELPALVLSAIGHGFYRALVNRMTTERNLTHEWWVAKRREYAGAGKDRSADLQIILDEFPDFGSYYPSEPLTDEEVLDAAKQEFRDSIAAGGTDYHQLEMQKDERTANVGNGVEMLSRSEERGYFQKVPITDDKVVILDTDEGNIDFVDPTAQDKVENVLFYRMLEDDQHPFGPLITKVAQIAIREYGQSGLFWIVERMFLPTRYHDVLRTMGGTEQELGKKEFERVKKTMSRKLPEITARMRELLVNDPEMQQLRETLWGDGGACKAKAPTTAGDMDATKASERDRFIERTRAKLLTRMQRDDDVKALVPAISALSAEQVAPFLHAFTKVVKDDIYWPQVKKAIQKQFKNAA